MSFYSDVWEIFESWKWTLRFIDVSMSIISRNNVFCEESLKIDFFRQMMKIAGKLSSGNSYLRKTFWHCEQKFYPGTNFEHHLHHWMCLIKTFCTTTQRIRLWIMVYWIKNVEIKTGFFVIRVLNQFIFPYV